ncbi:MAG TPA: thioredoxin-like domain-containing protein, partial [Bacteroidia bacterium]|nr:thioredoxin-like domain-containing protein [Bacteroidia bacterium]
MTKQFYKILFLVFLSYNFVAQNCTLKSGSKAGAIVLMNNQNTLQSLTFPYYNKLVLVHFWSSSVAKSKLFIPRAIDLEERYSTSAYRNAEGFEVITVAVQSDKTAWKQDLADLKMDKTMNLIASKGYNDMSVCNFKITQLPVTLLIDEIGSVILINPTQLEIEEILDAKKNAPQNTRDLKGMLLFSENTKDVAKNQKMVLMNKFSDTISRTITDNRGQFTFTAVKFLTEYIVKFDTTGDMSGKQKACLSTFSGNIFVNLTKAGGKYEYFLTLADIANLSGINKENNATKNAITFNANITFKKNT